MKQELKKILEDNGYEMYPSTYINGETYYYFIRDDDVIKIIHTPYEDAEILEKITGKSCDSN